MPNGDVVAVVVDLTGAGDDEARDVAELLAEEATLDDLPRWLLLSAGERALVLDARQQPRLDVALWVRLLRQANAVPAEAARIRQAAVPPISDGARAKAVAVQLEAADRFESAMGALLLDGELGRVVHRRPRVVADDRSPVLEVDAADMAAARYLARVVDEGQFAVTEDGEVFIGFRWGNHRDQDRVYVSGYLPALDSVAVFIHRHRSGYGGRFYLHPSGKVECANCRAFVTVLSREALAMLPELCPVRDRLPSGPSRRSTTGRGAGY